MRPALQVPALYVAEVGRAALVRVLNIRRCRCRRCTWLRWTGPPRPPRTRTCWCARPAPLRSRAACHPPAWPARRLAPPLVAAQGDRRVPLLLHSLRCVHVCVK